MRYRSIRLLFALTLALRAAPALAETYVIDPVHSSVNFRIAHLIVSKVRGTFNQFSGTFDYDEKDPKKWKAEAEIEVASIDTRIEKRDGHLRTPDFFDVEKFPKITFKSTGADKIKKGKFVLKGELTIHGVTKPVTLEVELGGTVKGPDGLMRAGFSAKGRINRKDFGLTWNQVLETGGVMVGEDVEIQIDVEGIQKQ